MDFKFSNKKYSHQGRPLLDRHFNAAISRLKPFNGLEWLLMEFSSSGRKYTTFHLLILLISRCHASKMLSQYWNCPHCALNISSASFHLLASRDLQITQSLHNFVFRSRHRICSIAEADGHFLNRLFDFVLCDFALSYIEESNSPVHGRSYYLPLLADYFGNRILKPFHGLDGHIRVWSVVPTLDGSIIAAANLKVIKK